MNDSIIHVFNCCCQALNGYFLGWLFFKKNDFAYRPRFQFYISRFYVLYEWISRMTTELPYSLFQINGFRILSLIELRIVVNTVNVNRES